MVSFPHPFCGHKTHEFARIRDTEWIEMAECSFCGQTKDHSSSMILKWLFDRTVSLAGLLLLWPVMVLVAILIKIRMPGGPVFFVQDRIGQGGRLFKFHKFRTMTMAHHGSSVTVAGDSRITVLGNHMKYNNEIL